MVNQIAHAILAALGLLMMFGGLVCAGIDLSRDTTVASAGGEKVHNTGLIAERQVAVTLDCAVGIIGAVLLGASLVASAVAATSAQRRKAEEAAQMARQTMLHALSFISANTRPRQVTPPPAIQSMPQPDPAFDAAIAAELIKPPATHS